MQEKVNKGCKINYPATRKRRRRKMTKQRVQRLGDLAIYERHNRPNKIIRKFFVSRGRVLLEEFRRFTLASHWAWLNAVRPKGRVLKPYKKRKS